MANQGIRGTSVPASDAPRAHPTSSTKGTLYFAFGSNLSTSQMTQRCPSSAKPLAVAKLSSYAWFICGRGYANVIALPPYHPNRDSLAAKDSHATTIWGLIYLLTSEDEKMLDGYEGFREDGCDGVNPVPTETYWRPWLQGKCAYNKLYLLMEVTKWLVDNPDDYCVVQERPNIIRSLVYVDEVRTYPGRIKHEYVKRMSRAVKESIPLGIPQAWVDAVMKQHGIDPSMGDDQERNSEASRTYLVAPPREKWEAIREQQLGD